MMDAIRTPKRAWVGVWLWLHLSACGPSLPGGDPPDASGTAVSSSTDGNDVLISGTGDCDLEPHACYVDSGCGVLIGDGEVCRQELPPGPGIRLLGDADCTLQHLRDGVVAALQIDECLADGTGLHDNVVVLGDGTATLQRTTIIDTLRGQSVHEPMRRLVVRPPAYFDECLQTEDLTVVRECLFRWFEPGQCIPEACCPGENNADLPPC